MTPLLAFLFCATAAHVLVGDAKAVLDAARSAADVQQFAKRLGDRVSELDTANDNPLLELQTHERPELHIASTLALQRAFAGCLGTLILLYTTRTFCLARRRRLYGLRSSVALPLDYRLQKRLVKASRSAE